MDKKLQDISKKIVKLAEEAEPLRAELETLAITDHLSRNQYRMRGVLNNLVEQGEKVKALSFDSSEV